MIGANCGLKEDEEIEKMAKTAKNISACISKEKGLEDFGRKYIYEVRDPHPLLAHESRSVLSGGSVY